ncbi:hypothetical protein H6P81_016551 [Aristolochia fimbriata]|uniref:UspA domain-containing protein n=1 Tax=Aristolochia fimbriata TaxID=158543 RepID=A0AAV7EBJ7_ARIFI|nr:hypothetical protein H6P81_016551 [Aristolochia fimbriata]
MDTTMADPGITTGVPIAAGVVVDPSLTSGKKKMKAMVAVDDSDASLYALKWTVDHFFGRRGGGGGGLTRDSGDAREGTIVVLHVQQSIQGQFYQIGSVEAVSKLLGEKSAKIIARAVEVCSGSSATVESMVVEGEAKEMICTVAEKIHPDMAVVGSRGLGKIKRAFLGSVSDYCAHHLDCPVLIVKPRAQVI